MNSVYYLSMKTNLYSVTVPLFMRTLTNLANILEKSAHHAGENKYDLKHLMEDRLYPDMLPFVRQIQIACDTAKFAACRLSGGEAPAFPDDEKTPEDLIKRIRSTVEYLKSVSPDSFNLSEEKDITLPYFPDKTFDGFTYTTEYALPNFYFHATIAYALLRHNGVPLGKGDYLGPLSLKDKE